MTPAAAPRAPSTPEDWRVLRLLSLYRLMLITALLVIYQGGLGKLLFEQAWSPLFRYACDGYAITALLLFLPLLYRTPRVVIQAHIQFALDTMAITLLVYASGGVPNGLGILLIAPAISSAILLTPRLAVVQAAAATLAMFGEELLRQSASGFVPSEFTATGMLGLTFFATSIAATTLAARARRSEALAERVGSDLANMSRLNENIIATMQTGVVVVNAQNRIHTINAAAQRFFLGAAAAVGSELEPAAPTLFDALQAWRGGGGADNKPLTLAPASGEVIPRFAHLGWGANAPVLILLEDAAALHERAQQMKLAALGRLSASIAHEIRNPLSAITHAGQLLAESSEIQGENQRLLAMIQRHGERINKIIHDVLEVSRRDAGERTALPLKNWLIRTAGLYHESHPQRPRPIELLEVGADITVRFDPHHLQQVLFNLWDNSFEHGAGRNIVVLVSAGHDPESGRAWLEVRDNGPGIPRELLDRIFEPFFSTATRGTGLGLYLSRELCEYNQARLLHVPQPDGACFRILFGTDQRPAP